MTNDYSFPCSNRQGGVCLVISDLIGKDYTPDPRACDKCAIDKNPMSINRVTCGIAHARCLVEGVGYTDQLRKHSHLIGAKREPRPRTKGPGSMLKQMIPDFFESDGCGCDKYANKMDNWGVSGCERRIDEIVSHLVDQSEKVGHGLGVVAKVIPKSVRQSVARKLVEAAIEKSKGANNAR